MQNAETTHEVVVTVLVEFIGVALLAVLAGTNDNVGKVAVTLMAGFLLIWLMSNATELTKIVGKT